MTARKVHKVWTKEEILRDYPLRMPGKVACAIVYNAGETKALRLLRTGQVDFKVIRVPGTGRTFVPTSSVLRLLEVDDAPTTGPADVVTATPPNQGPDQHGSATDTRLLARGRRAG
jgi:hypothetical protein